MSTTTPEFVGFSDETFLFLRQLAENNDRMWFEKNRKTYEDHLIAPAKLLVTSIGARLEEFSPNFQADPRINGSIVRINRDIRFSKDKTPYKTHLDLWFWEGKSERTWDCSGFFFRLSPQSLILGTGIHSFSKPTLAAYREAIVNPPEGSALINAIRRVEQAGPYEMGGDSYKRVPTGYDPDSERAEFLKRKGLFAQIEGPIPHNISWTTASLIFATCTPSTNGSYRLHPRPSRPSNACFFEHSTPFCNLNPYGVSVT